MVQQTFGTIQKIDAVEQRVQKHAQIISSGEQTNIANVELVAYIEAIERLALVSITDRKGRILHVNNIFCRVSGYSFSELLGQDHRILNSGAHPKAFFVNMWREIAHGRIWHQEICNRTKHGELYWVDSTIVPIKSGNDHIDRFLSVRVDITARKEREAYLEKRLKARDHLFEIRREILRAQSIASLIATILSRTVLAMQFPQAAVSTIYLDGKRYSSDALDQVRPRDPSTLQSDICVKHRVRGWIQVAYREPRPFLLPEERDLVQSVAEDFGAWLDRQETEAYVRYQADHDGLTQLPNRRYLKRKLKKLIEERRQEEGRFAIMFIDLDHFKGINDTLGHEMGDLLLKEVAARLLACMRHEDIVVRQGGDEFIVLIQSVQALVDVEIIAQKLVEQMMQPFCIENKVLRVGASVGIALFPEDGQDVKMLLRCGDLAMYQAKHAGRNGYQFFSRELDKLMAERHRTEVALRRALDNNELVLHFQPIVDDINASIASMEVLLRWQHPEDGLVPPARFIPLAEETGLIVPIGAWVIRTACLQINTWQQQGLTVPRLTINLSVRQLGMKDFVDDVRIILQETGVAADLITLEVTESMLAKNVNQVAAVLRSLSALGFRIAIDDFGTGYSCMSSLKHYPIDLLKIDRHFVRDVCIDENDAAIVTAIIAMAHGLGIEVVAEGVESIEQLDFLRKKNCKFYQGYLFCKPLPAAEIIHLLQKKTRFEWT
ncbi:EAL domain-containing protein [Nitrosomonas sp. ANs5]|uniref:EAL domain-containing protein n=1 Tax=Nitrosomonas sp. ANs5 TaxID=3423941 RepID=UPI003D33E852